MIGQEIPRSNLQIHWCDIEHVYDSGLIDARSERGRVFERINICTNGVDGTFALGDECIVLTDGAQNFAIGTARRVEKTGDAGETIHDFDPGFMDWNQTKVISANDAFGSSARLYVSPGGGVIVDTGEWCVAHYSPGNAKLIQYLERMEIVMPAHHADIDHDGEEAEANYTWQTRVDAEATERRVQKTDAPDQHTDGHTLTVQIKEGEGDAIVQAELYNEGSSTLTVQMEKDGTWAVDSDGDVRVTAQEAITQTSEDKVVAEAGKASVTVDNRGIGKKDEVVARAGDSEVLVRKDGKVHLLGSKINLQGRNALGVKKPLKKIPLAQYVDRELKAIKKLLNPVYAVYTSAAKQVGPQTPKVKMEVTGEDKAKVQTLPDEYEHEKTESDDVYGT